MGLLNSKVQDVTFALLVLEEVVLTVASGILFARFLQSDNSVFRYFGIPVFRPHVAFF